MFFTIFKSKVRLHAQRVLSEIFEEPYDGEVFICGGAFKPLLKRGVAINDLDLWVRDRKARERLLKFLLSKGATVVRDFHPYCLKLRKDGRLIEITYHNVKDGSLQDVVNTFDLAICAIGARYMNGSISEVCISEECWHGVKNRTVQVLPSYLCALQALRTPSIIRTLHRMAQKATELGYEVDAEHEHLLWDIFWKDFTEEQRRAAMDLYFETMVSYKGHCDERVLRRAAVYVPSTPSATDTLPIQGLAPQPA